MSQATSRSRRSGIRRGEAASGWLFTAPVILLLGVFLVIPVLMALWVSFSDWGGRGSPFSSDVHFVGLKNYTTLLAGGGLAEQDFGTSLKNNAWYVVLVVPIQTAVSLGLAVLVNRAVLRGRGFFRTAFYFPSVTSSVAITVLWLFLFSTSGAVNKVLAWVGINGPNWFNDPSGIIHNLLAAFGVATIASRLLGGWLCDRWSARATMVTGLVATAVAQLAVAAATTIGQATLAVVALGLAFEIYEPPSQALVADLTPPEQRPAAYGLLGGALAAAGMAGMTGAFIGKSAAEAACARPNPSAATAQQASKRIDFFIVIIKSLPVMSRIRP